jgi:TrmH family RNA methyltransferase
VLTSPANPRLKAVAALRKRRGRADGQILIDGARALGLALEAGVGVEAVYHCPDLDPPETAGLLAEATAKGAEVLAVARAAFGRIAYGAAPDSVVAVARRPAAGLDGLPSDPTLVLVVVGLEKPGNLGALFRTADAAGADAVIVADGKADPFGPNAVRASRGTVFTTPLAEADGEAAAAWLHARGLTAVAALPEAETPHTAADLSGPVAIVLGEEHAGLPAFWRQAAGVAVRVPMRGRADSLNVAVTGALLLFEAVRQREGGKGPGGN